MVIVPISNYKQSIELINAGLEYRKTGNQVDFTWFRGWTSCLVEAILFWQFIYPKKYQIANMFLQLFHLSTWLAQRESRKPIQRNFLVTKWSTIKISEIYQLVFVCFGKCYIVIIIERPLEIYSISFFKTHKNFKKFSYWKK